MRHRLRLTPQARRDLNEITLDIGAEAGWRVAANWAKALRDKAKSLIEHPFKGPPATQLGAGRRKLSHPPYLLIYEVSADGVISIIRVLHGSRDLDAIFTNPADD